MRVSLMASPCAASHGDRRVAREAEQERPGLADEEDGPGDDDEPSGADRGARTGEREGDALADVTRVAGGRDRRAARPCARVSAVARRAAWARSPSDGRASPATACPRGRRRRPRPAGARGGAKRGARSARRCRPGCAPRPGGPGRPSWRSSPGDPATRRGPSPRRTRPRPRRASCRARTRCARSPAGAPPRARGASPSRTRPPPRRRPPRTSWPPPRARPRRWPRVPPGRAAQGRGRARAWRCRPSRARSTSVPPELSMWSNAMRVMAAARGVGMTFVASSRPPSPTSTTARSTFAARNARNPARVAVSKKLSDGPRASASARSGTSASSPMGSPSMRMRSAKRARCGDVRARSGGRSCARWPRPSPRPSPCRWSRRRGRSRTLAPGSPSGRRRPASRPARGACRGGCGRRGSRGRPSAGAREDGVSQRGRSTGSYPRTREAPAVPAPERR